MRSSSRAAPPDGSAYARAMGPMQFLPGTWARYASDGDGDGVADPQNLYDATLAAARYLCSGGLNLRDQSQVLSSILRYNNSMPYAQNVLGWAAAYATGVVPVDLPPLTGPAPPLGDAHLENAEGLGPNLPMNMHGLPSTDPLAQMPLIDLSGGPSNGPQPWSTQRPGPVVHGDLHQRRYRARLSRRSMRRRPRRACRPPRRCAACRRSVRHRAPPVPRAAAAAPLAPQPAPAGRAACAAPVHRRPAAPPAAAPPAAPPGSPASPGRPGPHRRRLKPNGPAPQRAVPARIVADSSPMVRLLSGPSRPASSPHYTRR